jgi:sugar phosphate isomerase/epimerase
MSIRLSCNDYAWPVLSHRVVLDIIKDLGYEAVDIGLFADATHVTLSSVRDSAERRADEVGSDVAAAGLVVADVFLTSSMQIERLTPTSRVAGDQAELQAIFADTLQFAARLGAPGVTLLPGVMEEGVSRTEAIDRAAEGLRPLVEMGAERGLGVSVEPHVGSCIETPEETLELLDRCPGLTITFDPSHYIYQGISTAKMLPVLGRVRHVQIRPAATGVMQARTADNEIDLPAIFAELHGLHYDGWVASEFVWMEKWRCNETDNTGESARLRDLMRPLAEGGR